MARKVGVVYETTNYSMFKKLPGNRDVSEARVNAIGKSIDKYGYVGNPILVTEKMEVIDGQGRVEACKRRGIPVPYMIVKDVNVEECRALNACQFNWKLGDFIESYAELGNTGYKYLIQLMKEFPLSPAAIVSASKLTAGGRQGITKSGIASGEYTITQEQYEQVRRRLAFCMSCFTALGDKKIFGRIDLECAVLSFAFEHPKIDNDVLISKIEKYKRDEGLLLPCKTISQVAEEVTKIYNYHNRRKILLNYEYEAWRMENKGNSGWFSDVDKPVKAPILTGIPTSYKERAHIKMSEMAYNAL